MNYRIEKRQEYRNMILKQVYEECVEGNGLGVIDAEVGRKLDIPADELDNAFDYLRNKGLLREWTDAGHTITPYGIDVVESQLLEKSSGLIRP